MIFRDVREDPFTVYGLYHNRQEPVFRRLPQSVAMQANEGVQTLHTNTAGGRVKFKTNSKTITIPCDMPSLCDMPHMPRCGSSGFDLYVKKGARYWHTGTFMPNDFDRGYTASYSFPCQQERDLLLHFPLYSDVTSLHIGWMTVQPCRLVSPIASPCLSCTTARPSRRAAVPPDLEIVIRP